MGSSGTGPSPLVAVGPEQVTSRGRGCPFSEPGRMTSLKEVSARVPISVSLAPSSATGHCHYSPLCGPHVWTCVQVCVICVHALCSCVLHICMHVSTNVYMYMHLCLCKSVHLH